MTKLFIPLQLTELAQASIACICGDPTRRASTPAPQDSQPEQRVGARLAQIIEVTRTVTCTVTRTSVDEVTAKTPRDVTTRDGSCIHSDPKGSAVADAPAPASKKSDRKRLFAEGTRLLMESGTVCSVGAARSFLGLLNRDWKKTAISALHAAIRECPADPKPYLLAACKRMAEEMDGDVAIAAAAQREFRRTQEETEKRCKHAQGVTPEQLAQRVVEMRALKERLCRDRASIDHAV